ncbi:B12-binding domain-containing radical SAM protein [Vibrio sp. HN007]|uniref:B12-binding domain-containing radical SAM protein n=1 Tax=Vibrio iocasae TaxID=3098914 RepID=UPI0035D475BF
MKITLINACYNGFIKPYKRHQITSSYSLSPTVAALSGLAEVEVIDEALDRVAPYRANGDLVVIFTATPDAMRAYELADMYMRQGIHVVLAGLHPTAMTLEALQHCNSVVRGEPERLWSGILSDFREGQLKPLYCTVSDILDNSDFYSIDETVSKLICNGQHLIELNTHALNYERAYLFELFKAMKHLSIHWTAESIISIADDKVLLEAAIDAGLRKVIVGIEAPFDNILKPKQSIQQLRELGLAVECRMIFGLDTHDNQIFDRTWSYVQELGIDICHPTILTPYPGTLIYDELEQEGRILTKDWSQYDGEHTVFVPANMSPGELESGVYNFAFRNRSADELIHKKEWKEKRFVSAMCVDF